MDSGITFFTSFKEFDDQVDNLGQSSAVFSWIREQFNANPILAIGDGTGIPEFCKRHGITLIPGVQRARDQGLGSAHPMLRDFFQIALGQSKTPYLCLINSDIIVCPGFHVGLGKLLYKYSLKNPFITGIRHNIKLGAPAVTEKDYLALWSRKDVAPHSGGGSDYFAFSRELMAKILAIMPDYVLGAAAWDNWLHWCALNLSGAPVCTMNFLKILHPNHVYRQLNRPTEKSIYDHPAVKHNLAIYKAPGAQKASTAGGRWIRL